MRAKLRSLAPFCLMMNALIGCAPERVVFDASAIPTPPSFSPDFRRGLGAEILACQAPPLMLEYVRRGDGYFDQINRLKGVN